MKNSTPEYVKVSYRGQKLWGTVESNTKRGIEVKLLFKPFTPTIFVQTTDILAWVNESALGRFYGLGSPYIPASESCAILDTIVPDSMDYETHITIRKIKQETGGNLIEFVRGKLQYTHEELCNALAAEQIDAVAMAIYNIEFRGQGMIIGDQTGIGKGRVAAAMIRYGCLNGFKPVFMSEKPNLFSDIYRDLSDIGSADLVPFIVNGREGKTDVKDENGNIVYQALPPTEQAAVFKSKKLSKQFDYVLCTYSQVNSPETKPVKPDFIASIASNNIIIMDEAHNASGSSNTGEYLQGVLSGCRGVVFLSATFAKRPDNMPIYASKTAMQDANMTRDELVEAIIRGGVALQEILSSQLVSEGQMLRRERSFDGVEVNYITLDDLEQEHKAISDNITEIIRDIIEFQETFVDKEIDEMDGIVAAEGKQIKERGGTSKAGVDNAPYFSKVFNVINQMLFSIKAEAVASLAIERLKEGKKPVIAFSSTMGSFLENMENEHGVPVSEGDVINADFKSVLIRGLEGVLRYTVKDHAGNSEYKSLSLASLSKEAQNFYFGVIEKINRVSTGITISPIDIIIQRIEDAGYSVAEVTGRKLEIQFNPQIIAQAHENKAKDQEKQKTQTEKSGRLKTGDIARYYPNVFKLMPKFQQNAIVGSEEHWDILDRLEAIIKAMPKNTDNLTGKMKKEVGIDTSDLSLAFLHFFRGGSDWWILDWDGSDRLFGYAVLNGDWMFSEYGYVNKSELEESFVEMDFFFHPSVMYDVLEENDDLHVRKDLVSDDKLKNVRGWYKAYLEKTTGGLAGLGKPSTGSMAGVVLSRKRVNTNDAFRMFNNNEVDVLMINQSGSTGASAHAIVTDKVPIEEVKQRVMIILQAELNINTEVQKRGRINRTGQIYKPIYDYVTSAIPAERRLMMMVQKKLKSLDANTTSNQKQSEKILSVDDFLNKYGDKVVHEYLIEHKALNKALGDPLGIEDDDKEAKDIKENLAHKVSGRVAVLPTSIEKGTESEDENNVGQEEFYREIIDRYNDYINYLKDIGEYDLEVETMNLEAETKEARVVIVGKGGQSVFGMDTILERCSCNVLKKPFTKTELDNLIRDSLKSKAPEEIQKELQEDLKDFMLKKVEQEIGKTNEKYDKLISGITTEKGYLKIAEFDLQARNQYINERTTELNTSRNAQIERDRTEAENAYRYIHQFFQAFKIGEGYNFPFTSYDQGSVNVPSVFLGFAIQTNRANPYTPSAIKARFALADSNKYVALALSGEMGNKLLAVAGASAHDWQVKRYNATWDLLIKSSSVNRRERIIITGNLLQAFSQYKGKLVSFTTIDQSTRKGILMPENYQEKTRHRTQKVVIPIGKAKEIIMNSERGGELRTTNGIVFEKDYYREAVKMIVPKSKAYKPIYTDLHIIELCTDPADGFNMVSNKMVATFLQNKIPNLIEILQKKFSLSLEVDPDDYHVDVSVDSGQAVQTKDKQTIHAEQEFIQDKQAFECRKDPASCGPIEPVKIKHTPDQIATKLRLLKLKMQMLSLNG